MTSTVLDVTVLLLCVSASVVALGAADSDRRAAGPEVAEVADLIVTETVTVTYASAEAPNGTRTVHATRAELLALVAAENEGGGGKRAAREAFESEALAAIDRGIGPRTRVDAEVRTLDETEDEAEGETGAPSPGIVVSEHRAGRRTGLWRRRRAEQESRGVSIGDTERPVAPKRKTRLPGPSRRTQSPSGASRRGAPMSQSR